MIKFYSKPQCPNCNIAELAFYRAGIDVDKIELTEDVKNSLIQEYNSTPRSLPFFEYNNKLYLFEERDKLISEVKSQDDET